MRKNVKQQLALRVLSTAALMAMVSSIATAAFADTYDLNKGSVDILAEGGEQRITQWADKDKDLCVKDDNGEDIRNIKDPDIVLTTKDETTGETKTTSNTVTIDAKEGNTANVTLDNVHIEVDPNDATFGAIEIKGDGNTNLELDGDNTVLTECWVGEAHAAIEKADKYGTGTLTIKDDVNDDGTAKGTDADTTGKLLACGYEEASAIGGGGREAFVIHPTLPSPAAISLPLVDVISVAALAAAETASRLKITPLSKHTVLMVLPLAMAV